MFLVDTNILSAVAPTKAVPATALGDWMDRNSAGLFVSVITIAEIEDGIAKARREGATRKAGRIADWLGTLLHLYEGRVLHLDLAGARALGRLADRARAAGLAPGLADLAIAATAMTHGLTILTRNVRHFVPLAVPAHDPVARLPE